MKKTILIHLLVSCVVVFNGYAQKAKEVPNTKSKDNFNNIDLLKTYERVAEKGYKSIDMLRKLANACYFNSELEKAVKWYDELFTMTSNLEPEYYYRYAQCLMVVGQNDKAKEMTDKFNQLSKK